jgi:macrolide transport system ATP-binding/permease protein
MMDTLWQDFRFGMRLLLKNPGFTAIAVLVLALGIGANAAIFSLINAVLLRPPAGVLQPERLVLFQRVQDGNLLGNFGYPDYLDYKNQVRSFAGLAAYCGTRLSMSDGSSTERVIGQLVSDNYFSVLGVQARAGRLLRPEDENGSGDRVVVISYAIWQRSFGADKDIVGRNIRLNGQDFTVVGVAARGFSGPDIGMPIDVWLPVTNQPVAIPRMSSDTLQSRASGWLTVFGRLNSGVPLPTAQAEVNTFAGQLAEAYPGTNKHRSALLSFGIGIDPDDRSHMQTFLGFLFAAVSLLLLIACGNVANLLLGRAAARQREMAVRQAMGAARGRLVRQLLTEGLLLSLMAGAIGILLARWIASVILAFQPPASLLRGLELSLDSRILGFTLLMTVATGLLFALAPAMQASKTDLVTALKGGTPTAGGQRSVLQKGLVIAQVSFSLVLLIAAGLLARTMQKILAIDPGFEAGNMMLTSVDLSIQGYSESQGKIFYDQIIRRLRAIPGVTSASMAFTVPPNEYSTRRAIFYPGQEPLPSDLQGREFEVGLRVDVDTISTQFFRTLGITLLRGRDFNDHDTDRATPVAIVNERLAQRLWPGQDAVGKRIAIPPWSGPAQPPVEVIGIAKDTKYRTLLSDPPLLLYLPVAQNYDGRATLIVRATTPARLLRAIRAEIAGLDMNLPVFGVETMQEHVASSLWEQRMTAGLISIFGLFALTLAATGLYGVIAYSVAQRTREMGIRMALGARRIDIFRLVVGQGLRLALIGVAAGVGIGLGATRGMSGLLYGVSAGDPPTFVAISLLLVGVALAASWLPARRATKIDPMIALRYE